MSKIFVTSDSHFGHDRQFLYGPRGFSDIHEHDEEVIRRWNMTVGPDDVVYHLGDVMLNDNEYGMSCLARLNGTIYIIPGNHDTLTRLALYDTLENVTVLPLAYQIKYKKYNFYLSHHPTMTSNLEKDPYLRMHLINIFGHTHQKSKFYNDIPFMFCACMDAHNSTPVLLDDAIEMMKAEMQRCIKMLDVEPEVIEAPTVNTFSLPEPVNGGCRNCTFQGQCSGFFDNVRCKEYVRDAKDGGYYG